MAKLGRDANVISHWHHPIENFQTSAMEFYAAVAQALLPRQIPDYTVSRIDWREGGVLTARREYLRIKRGKLAFDLCAAPFGTGFFFSWWLAEIPPSNALLVALMLCGLGVVFIVVMMQVFGVITGFFWGIVIGLGASGLFGYLLSQGRLGTEAEDMILAIPVAGLARIGNR